MSYEAVFLDLDDTLYPYPPCNEAGKRAAFAEAQRLGYDLSRAAFDELYQHGRRETKRELAGTASAHERFLYFKRAIRHHTGTSDAADALALGEAYWGAYLEEMALFDGAVETLEALRDAGLSVAIVSNLTTRIQLKKIRRLGLDPLVDEVLTSEETGREKPSAIMFTLPLAELDLRPSEAVMVGDSVRADVEGGNAVGMDTVLLDHEREDDDAGPSALSGHERPDHRVTEFAALTDVLL
ncbi:HAD family hydrolase [Haloparvum alkalitolerans]|uniref:HAD family hydrolase n=1 Tax=Haloparvum alkalitolerans TaxID=1042953 RepID=UPI003CEBF324